MIFLAVPTVLFFVVQYPKVQTYLVTEATKTLSQKLNTTVSVESVHFRFFNHLVMKKVYMQDLSGDTLAYAEYLDVSLRHIHLQKRQIGIGTLELGKFQMHLVRDSVKTVNLKKVFQSLHTSSRVDTTPKDNQSFGLKVKCVRLKNASFSFIDHSNYKPIVETSINYHNLDVKNISCEISNIYMSRDTLLCSLEFLTLLEKSGFHLQKLSGEVTITSTLIELKNMILQDGYSDIHTDFYRMEFDAYRNFPDYIDNVRMSAFFRNAQVDFYTIGFFAPKLKRFYLPVYLTGFASGPVSNLRGKDLEIRAGKESFTNVSFSMKGIPDVSNTFFTFDVQKIHANSQDLLEFDRLLLKPHKYNKLLEQLEYITGQAHFTGFFSSFVAEGKFSTSKGDILSDLSLSPIDSSLSMKGSLGTTNFDIGGLLNDSIFGNLSFFGQINGKIYSLKHFSLTTDVTVPQVEINKYCYNNVEARGNFTEHSFKGGLQCKDENLDLSFLGDIYFEKGKKNEFDFNANITQANLSNLKWITHDSLVTFSGVLEAAGAGFTIDDFTGHLELIKSNLSFGTQSFTSNYMILDAQQLGTSHNISLQSDILDAQLQSKGKVSRLPHTLQRLAKYYVPVLDFNSDTLQQRTKSAKDEQVRQYSFFLRTKKLEHLIKSLQPDIVIADSTELQGVISSDRSLVTLDAKVPLLQYKNNRINFLELRVFKANDTALNLNLQTENIIFGSQKAIDFSIHTNLSHGHANLHSSYTVDTRRGVFNTSATAYKSLDRKGSIGIEFNLDTSRILLSDTIFNIHPCAISVEKNRIALNDFKMFNDKQELYFNGIISPKLSDTLLCEFKELSIAPIVRAFNDELLLTGRTSGQIKINGGLCPSPLFFGNLRVANAFWGKDTIGDMTLKSFTEDGEKDITLYLKVERNKKELLHIGG
ncbi:MAG: hypothetical protein ACRCSB_06260, partial [Bacteroidales bacterium]